MLSLIDPRSKVGYIEKTLEVRKGGLPPLFRMARFEVAVASRLPTSNIPLLFVALMLVRSEAAVTTDCTCPPE